MKFIDWFAGIGGFRIGMEKAGHECVGFCEFDRFAVASYTSMHLLTDEQRDYLMTLPLKQRQKEILNEEYRNGEWYAADIRRVSADDIPSADCWCFGFPCQDISVANTTRREGFQGNRSSLFFRVMYLLGQVAEEKRPHTLLIENVRNLLGVNGGWDFARLLVEMERGGYDAEWQILNSKHFGSAQNRERLFIVGHTGASKTRRVFPIGKTTNGVLKTIQCDTSGKGLKSQQERIYLPDGIMCCLPNARAETKCATVIDNDIHILTAKERLRLQGFSDEYIKRAYFINRPKELVQQAGNSVTVNVIEKIAKRLT